MSAGCSYCGAPVRARTEGGMARSVNAWISTRYECGTESHSDGVDRSAECRRREAESKSGLPHLREVSLPDPDVAPSHAVLVADVEMAPAIAPKSLEQQVAEWRESTEAAALAAVAAVEGVTIADHADGPVKGRKAVEAARLALKRVRTPIEARRKELKAPIVALSRLVDDEAKRLTDLVKPREEALENEVMAYDAEQARIKREAEEAERKRVQGRLDSWIAAEGDPAQIPNLADLPEDAFQVILGAAQEAKQERDEIRERKLSEERAERERQEQEVRDRIAAAEKKLEEEREALARERADLEAARKVVKEQQDKLNAEARAEQKRKDDQAKAEADAAAELERIAKADQERRDAEARREAQRPDREKIAAWCEAVSGALLNIPTPAIEDADLNQAAHDCRLDILNRINILATETKENA